MMTKVTIMNDEQDVHIDTVLSNMLCHSQRMQVGVDDERCSGLHLTLAPLYAAQGPFCTVIVCVAILHLYMNRKFIQNKTRVESKVFGN